MPDSRLGPAWRRGSTIRRPSGALTVVMAVAVAVVGCRAPDSTFGPVHEPGPDGGQSWGASWEVSRSARERAEPVGADEARNAGLDPGR